MKSYVVAGNLLLQILSHEAIAATLEGLCIIELHSCDDFRYRRDATDGELKASYRRNFKRSDFSVCHFYNFLRLFKAVLLALTLK